MTLSEGGAIMTLIIVLLAIWLALVIIGFAVKALLWLAIVGIVLFVVTGIYGAIRSRTS
jgi:apolipoprotein N-acyltransferase